jgi:hypothetical protein
MDEEPHLPVLIARLHQQVARLQHPSAVRAAGAGEVLNPAAADRQEDEHVQASQPHRVDGKEVTDEDRLAMRSQEGAPRQLVTLRCRRQPCLGEDVADRGRRDGDAELAQLADDPQVPPARILAREPQDQLPHLTADRRASRASVRVGPAASDKPAMPAQERLRPHQESVPAGPRQHAAQRRKKQPIARLEPRSADLTAKTDNSCRSTRISSSFARSLRPKSTINSGNRHTTTYSEDTSKGDLQQTGDADATSRSVAFARHPIAFLHPTR